MAFSPLNQRRFIFYLSLEIRNMRFMAQLLGARSAILSLPLGKVCKGCAYVKNFAP
jgi:hypothetical protein